MLVALMVSGAMAATPVGTGFIVGGATVGGALVGAAGGGLAGVGLGSLACRPESFECWGPAIGGGMGAVSGLVAGGVVTSGLVARRMELDPRRTRRWGMATVGAGGVIWGASTAVGLWGGATAGLVIATAGLPVATGIAAGTDAAVQVSPAYLPAPGGQGSYGIALSGRF